MEIMEAEKTDMYLENNLLKDEKKMKITYENQSIYAKVR